MKKISILCFTLAFMLFINISNASATVFPDLTTTEENFISDVIATEIMKGDDRGRFRPDAYLTKAEAATIVMKMSGYYNSYLAAPSTFNDVPLSHWASQVIGLATNLKLVKGNEDNCYEPDKYLNSAELITMCLRVIGVGELLDSTGRWPFAHMEFCQNEKILTKLSSSVYDPVTRLEAANIVSQFLSTNIWERNYITGLYEKTDENIMAKNLSIDYYKEAIISSIDKNDEEIDILITDEDGNYSETIDYLKWSTSMDIDDISVGDFANVYVKSNKIIKVDLLEDLDTRVLNYDKFIEFNYSSGYIRVRIDGKIKKYLLNPDILTVTANGNVKTGSKNNMSSVKRLILSVIEDEDYYDDDEDEYTISVTGKIILDSNDKVISLSLASYEKMIYVKSISNSKITGYSTSLHTCSGVKATSFSLTNKDYDIRNIDGENVDLDDVAQGDVLLYSYDGEPYTILLLDNSVNGKVTFADDDADYVTIGGEDYYRNAQFCSSLPNEGNRVTLFLDQSDNVIGWK